jgi:hypothetical protein
MAPPRQSSSSRKKSATQPKASSGSSAQTATAGELVCPECGRTFARAAALGAHRRRAHGVAGQSAQARRSRKVRQSARASSSAGRGRPATATTASRSPRSTQTDGDGSIDRNALLKTLFPGGLPAREEVIRAATGWLDDAERLARMR